MRRNLKELEAQEQLRALSYPLRLTDEIWLAEDNPLEYGRLLRRVEKLSEEYQSKVARVKRQWETSYAEHGSHFSFRELSQMAPGLQLDEVLAGYKIFQNYSYARENENKYLLQEDITKFPCMNYHLKEGPYCPPADAVFGEEDFHVVVKGDHDLIYFVPERGGLKKGRLIEEWM